MREAPSPATVIREVRPVEHSAVAELTVSVYADVLGPVLSDGYVAELSDVDRRAREAVVLVAVDTSDRLLGSVTFVPSAGGPYAEFEGPDEAGIRMLVVDPRHQRRGIGTALVQACIGLARETRRSRLALHTVEEMAGAKRLYERLGFRRAPERDADPEPGVHLLGYVLEL